MDQSFMETYPSFLIVGAQKSGTTTLFRDLEGYSDVFFPDDKEPGNLADPWIESEAGRRAYGKLFERGAGRICGEASTLYSKRPYAEGAASRALALLGRDTKIVYLMRDPVSRIESQYRHDFILGKVDGEGIDDAVFSNPKYIMYSMYGYQIEPWVRSFGAKNVLLLDFGEYIHARGEVSDRVARFIGSNMQRSAELSDEVFNRSSGKSRIPPWARRLARSSLYRNHIRTALGRRSRQKMVSLFFNSRRIGPADRLSEESRRRVLGILEGDALFLREMFGESCVTPTIASDVDPKNGPEKRC